MIPADDRWYLYRLSSQQQHAWIIALGSKLALAWMLTKCILGTVGNRFLGRVAGMVGMDVP